MACVQRARDRVRQLEDRLVREGRALEERREAYSKLLVQLGQDTAISQEHDRLITKQNRRITHLHKV